MFANLISAYVCLLRRVQAPAAQAEECAAEPVPPPQLLARFRVNQQDTLAVFKAVSIEDFGDVASLLPPNTALPAADKMTYLLARLEVCVSALCFAARHCFFRPLSTRP